MQKPTCCVLFRVYSVFHHNYTNEMEKDNFVCILDATAIASLTLVNRNMKTYKNCLLLLAFALVTSCVSQRQSVITGVSYDESKDETSYFATPYGAATLPGKWIKDHYNSVSFQQFLKNADSVNVAIAFISYKGYEFNRNGAKKGFEFAKAFYEWDSKFFVDTYGLQSTIIEEDSMRNYIVWRLFGTDKKGAVFDTYFLFGEKNGNATNLSISITDKWDAPRKIQFLKDLFLAKPGS